MIRVYTRPVEPDSYPEGLANSIHLAYADEGETFHPLNRNVGILFAGGHADEANRIVPMGVRNPGIFSMHDGRIGIIGERIHENGKIDEEARHKVLLWTTEDLIHFDKERLVDRAEIDQWSPSDTLSVDPAIEERAVRYWNPLTYTDMELPDRIRVRTEQELDAVCATLRYSDGSQRQKRVIWDKRGISFDRPGTVRVAGHIRQQRFSFPLAKGYGDPVVFPWEGKWYFLATSDNRNDIGIYVREADAPEELFADGIQEHLILPFDPARGFEQTFWAPEFHVIGGELYILFAVSGHQWGPQCHVMRLKKGRRITEAESWEDPIRVVRRDGTPLTDSAITLDMTFVRAQSGSYVIWSYREHIGTPMDSGSMLCIASVNEEEPWKLTSDPILLTRPLYGWENVSGTINNEGPHAFIRDGIVYVTYSGGAANGYTYALGLLTGRTDADLLDPHVWEKSVNPVLNFASVAGEFGPGHNSFFVNEDGELMIAYHAETAIADHLRCDGIRRVHFRGDGSPYFQMSAQEDVQDTEVFAEVEII